MPGPSRIPDEPTRYRPPPERPAGPLPISGIVPLDGLVAYANEVLSELANNRDLKSDEAGRPLYRLRSAGIDRECTWQLIEADFSGIGMATDMPLVVHAYSDSGDIEWSFGPTPIAATSRASSPKEAADVLNMDILLEGFRRFVLAESVLFPSTVTSGAGKERGPVTIDPEDGCCAECSGVLEVTAVDDATMTVECRDCGDEAEVEHDAFGDGGIEYVLEFLSRRGRD